MEHDVRQTSTDQRRTANVVSAISAVALLVGAVVFIIETDSWYLAFKAIHVVAAAIWIGAATLLALLAAIADRTDDESSLLQIGRQADWASLRLFIPASFTVLGFGLAATFNGDLDWGTFWIIFGLAGWVASTAIGIFYIAPKTKELHGLLAARGAGDPDVRAAIQRLLVAGRVDLAILLLIVVDMTVKPFS
jgi:uncharacterized membrane protein